MTRRSYRELERRLDDLKDRHARSHDFPTLDGDVSDEQVERIIQTSHDRLDENATDGEKAIDSLPMF